MGSWGAQNSACLVPPPKKNRVDPWGSVEQFENHCAILEKEAKAAAAATAAAAKPTNSKYRL